LIFLIFALTLLPKCLLNLEKYLGNKIDASLY
jgi:hypothetical protein